NAFTIPSNPSLSGVPVVTKILSGSLTDTVFITDTVGIGGANIVVHTLSGGINDVHIGGGANGTQGILGAVTLEAPENNLYLTYDDSADATGRTVNITPDSVTGLTPAAVNFSGLTSLSVMSGSGADSLDASNFNTSATLALSAG